MATVKLQDGKVILKNGKVSCSCCGGECCMYPAQALADGLYTVDDLPDEIVVINSNWTPFPGSVFTRNGSIYDGASESGSPLSLSAKPFAPGLPVVWILDTPDGPEYLDVNTPNCLLRDKNELPFGNGALDQFADTYTVEIISPVDISGTYTVTRRLDIIGSPCVWSSEIEETGEPAGVKLSYVSALILPGVGYTWEISFDVLFVKTGFANTPVGQYSDGDAIVS